MCSSSSLQGRPHADHELQHLRRHHDEVHGSAQGRRRYDLIDPATEQVVGPARRARVWDKMILGAWRTGEPGVFFIDEANRYNPVPHLGAYEATNPCGEQPLLPYDVCNLGSHQRRAVCEGRRDGLGRVQARHPALARTSSTTSSTSTSIRCRRSTRCRKRIRRIGLGVMGFADMLVRLGIPYDSAGRRGDGPQGHGVPRRREQEGERASGEGAWPVPRVGAVHLGPGRNVRARRERQAHSPHADAAQLQRHHRRADGHDQHHRGLLERVSSRCSPLRSCATRPA